MGAQAHSVLQLLRGFATVVGFSGGPVDSWPLVSSQVCGPAYPFLSQVSTLDCPAPTKAVPCLFQMSETYYCRNGPVVF